MAPERRSNPRKAASGRLVDGVEGTRECALEAIWTRREVQRIGNFQKVAEKYRFDPRFFCLFSLAAYRMSSRLDQPGLARLKVARRSSRHSDRPQSFQGEYRP